MNTQHKTDWDVFEPENCCLKKKMVSKKTGKTLQNDVGSWDFLGCSVSISVLVLSAPFSDVATCPS